jgi:hypothetical protein
MLAPWLAVESPGHKDRGSVTVAVNGDKITTSLDSLILRAQARVGPALNGKWRLEVPLDPERLS